jgi:hypothetical protein
MRFGGRETSRRLASKKLRVDLTPLVGRFRAARLRPGADGIRVPAPPDRPPRNGSDRPARRGNRSVATPECHLSPHPGAGAWAAESGQIPRLEVALTSTGPGIS